MSGPGAIHRLQFSEFLSASSVKGSGKTSSYIKALEHLGSMLEISSFGFDDCTDIFSVRSRDRLDGLWHLVQQEKEKGRNSFWLSQDVPSSYLLDGFCSAAIRSYQSFLASVDQQECLFKEYKEHSGGPGELVTKLDVEPEEGPHSEEELGSKEGRETARALKVRLNQNIFRSMILDMYENTCCISGLNIPALNIASHIIPWSENSRTRLDPTNGLCLSGTYDKAFDRNLITLDDDYRVVLSKGIRDYYPNDAVLSYFKGVEGQRIRLPVRYSPSLQHLSKHRASGDF